MNEIIDRIAQAICNAGKGQPAWDEATEYQRDFHRAEARAAIEAMREPTKAMLLAGHGANLCDNAPEVWQAMIDEALK